MPKALIIPGEGHLLVATGEEPTCKLECKYCFARTPEYRALLTNTRLSFDANQFDSRLTLHLGEVGENTILYSSRFHDLLAVEPEIGITILTKLLLYRRDISVLTRAAPDVALIKKLAEIDIALKEYGKRLIVEITCTSGIDLTNLEPGTPAIGLRIAALKEMKRRNMLVAVMISPLLPPCFAKNEDIFSLIAQAREAGVGAFTVDSQFLFTNAMAERMGYDATDDKHDGKIWQGKKSMLSENPKPIGWKYRNKKRQRIIIQKIQEADGNALSDSILTIRHLLQRER